MDSIGLKLVCAASMSQRPSGIPKTFIGRANTTEQKAVVVSNFRQKIILETLMARKSVSTAKLSKEFGVSNITIRRDLKMLSNAGYLRRTHGGAIWGGCHMIDTVLIVKKSEL